MKNPTWDSVYALEPRLLLLEHDIKRLAIEVNIGLHEQFCANQHWYGAKGFRARMNNLVGFDAENRLIRTQDAWASVQQHLYKLLPNCQHTSEFCINPLPYGLIKLSDGWLVSTEGGPARASLHVMSLEEMVAICHYAPHSNEVVIRHRYGTAVEPWMKFFRSQHGNVDERGNEIAALWLAHPMRKEVVYVKDATK